MCLFFYRHPYEEEIVPRDDIVSGHISPAELLRVVRKCASNYADKTYNFVFNNCQDFANHLSGQIGRTMKNPASSTSPAQVKSYWTAGDATLAATGTLAAIGLTIWGAMKIFGDKSQEEEDSEEESQKPRVKQGSRV